MYSATIYPSFKFCYKIKFAKILVDCMSCFFFYCTLIHSTKCLIKQHKKEYGDTFRGKDVF